MPQSMRGMPGNFGGQQQNQPSGRSVSSRLPNGKLGMKVEPAIDSSFSAIPSHMLIFLCYRSNKSWIRMGVRRECSDGRCWFPKPSSTIGRKRQFCAKFERVATCHPLGSVVRACRILQLTFCSPCHCSCFIPAGLRVYPFSLCHDFI